MVKSNKIALFVALAVLAIAAVAVVVVLITSGDDTPAAAEAAPQPITRAELMKRYAELNPIDRSATPETIDGLADGMCRALSNGHTTDKLITMATQQYQSKATEVVQLMVSYRCPDRLADFK